jgi:hypothetical protein
MALLVSLLNFSKLFSTVYCVFSEIVYFTFFALVLRISCSFDDLTGVKSSEWLCDAWSQNWISFISADYVRNHFTAIICAHGNVSILEKETWLECNFPAG